MFIDWYLPGYLAGGPIQSLASIVEYLSRDFNFQIITSNADLDGKPYKDIEFDKWLNLGDSNRIYYSASKLDLNKIRELTQHLKFDAVYLNSFFSFRFSILPLFFFKQHQPAVPVILAPRGMLGQGALGIKSMKKRAFLLFSRLLGLHKRVIWHATSQQEKTEIEEQFGTRRRVIVVPNLPRRLRSLPKQDKKQGALNVCFVARISQKKNLLYAIQRLKEIEKGAVVFTIFGPKENEEYWNQCEKEIRLLPPNIQVKVAGPIEPSRLEQAYQAQHVLLLPTLNENYGHSIVEALFTGTPVIISDQTPWTDLEASGAGFSLSLEKPKSFTQSIHYFLKMSQDEYKQASDNALKYISERTNIQSSSSKYKELFNGRNSNGSF